MVILMLHRTTRLLPSTMKVGKVMLAPSVPSALQDRMTVKILIIWTTVDRSFPSWPICMDQRELVHPGRPAKWE